MPMREAGQAENAETAEGTASRLVWADHVRSIAIVLVVLLHVCNKHFCVVGWPGGEWSQRTWTNINNVLWPLLMPAFYVIAGFFASRSLTQPWSKFAVRPAKAYYLYVLWLAIFGVWFSFAPTVENADFASPARWASNLVYPQQELWFLYGLAAFFVAAKMLRRFPLVAMALGFVAAVAAPTVIGKYGHSADVAQDAVYFLFGAYYPGLVERIVARTGWRDLALAAAAFGILSAIWQTAEPDFVLGPSVAAIWLAINVAAALAKSSRVARAMTVVGGRTLPIYVIHMLIIGLANWAFLEWLVPQNGSNWVAFLYPLVLTPLVVAASLLVESVLRAFGADFLFDLPKRWQAARATPLKLVDGQGH